MHTRNHGLIFNCEIMNKLYQILNRYANKYMNTRIVFVFDVLMSVLATFLSVLLVKILFINDIFSTSVVLIWLSISTVISAVLIWALKTYRIIIRHMSLIEFSYFILLSLFKCVALALIFIVIYGYSIGIYVLLVSDFFLTYGAFFALRVIMLVAYDFLKGKVDEGKKSQRVLVYGVGVNSVSLLSRLKDSPNYHIVAFLQYGSSTVSHVISDIKASYICSEDEFKDLVSARRVEAILFATEEDVQTEKDRIIRYAIDSGIKILFSPPIDELVDGKLTHSFRNIEIEDLLMRSEIKISMDEIIDNFKDKTIMVTGAAGSIGSELCRQLLTFGIDKLILFDNAETPMHNLRLELEEKYPDLKIIPVIGDVRLLTRLDYVFKMWHPQVVFHAAAYKHVPLMEDNPCEAVLVNVGGSRNVADKCLEYGAEMMVMVSTDKAVNPTNIMGCTKRLAEIYVQSMGLALESGRIQGKTKFVTTRFGNVLGSNGSVIPRFREQIAKGGPVTVTHPDITRFFMTIPEACRLVMEAATMSSGNQIFVFDMGESVKIDDLARRMIQLAGFTPDVDIKVEYTGLRPGEKLYEEVLANTENTLPTNHTRIRIAKVREYDYEEAKTKVNDLEQLSKIVDVTTMVRMMKQIVPEFISNNSRYQEYDNKK